MRILIIEDNIELCNSMKEGLEGVGFQVDIAYDGEIGEEKAYINEYDMILLDLNLPKKDGIDILKYLRLQKIETPVIITTARNEIEDLALGLDLGADDYLMKPYQFVELRARIQAVIRRFNGKSNPTMEIGQLSINSATRVASWQNKVITLASKEFDIVEYLCIKHPAVVSSEELMSHIYNEEMDPFSTVLRVHLSKLRKKLQVATGKNVLRTIRGKGYFICLDD